MLNETRVQLGELLNPQLESAQCLDAPTRGEGGVKQNHGCFTSGQGPYHELTLISNCLI